MNTHITLDNGMQFDFTNMFGVYRLRAHEIEKALKAPFCKMADEAVRAIRETGFAKTHLSKDGQPEHVFFPRMGYVKEGNPNIPSSINNLKSFASHLKNYDAVIFLGIGGSFLGNRVLFDSLGGEYWNTDAELRKVAPRICFAGNNVDSDAAAALVRECKRLAKSGDIHRDGSGVRIMLVPISESGTTLETMSGFLYFYNEFQKIDNITQDVAVVTDLSVDIDKSPLLQVAEQLGSYKFDIKEGIGGRFSIMTDPCFVTLAAMGGDIDAFLQGAREMDEYCQSASMDENPALLNALLKYMAYYRKGWDIEVFMPYCMRLKSLSEVHSAFSRVLG